ncbi:hypothetical protein ABGN05_13690 [Aquibium sp. LZ166]|uniref:Uncharacterized protein n=1 Tax=Aquibium pacificus TaxID=3153579 RepID=A0ABV3SJ00_9HYPH
MATLLSDQLTARSMISEVRTALLGAGLDCECEKKAKQTLDRLSTLGADADAGKRLEKSRQQREAIRRLLPFLSELDGLTPQEPDLSAFEEAAVLFDEVAAAAHGGAAALRDARELLQTARHEMGL